MSFGRRLALARQRGAVGQFGEGGPGGRAGGGAVGDEALAGLGDVQHLALELQRTGQGVVDVRRGRTRTRPGAGARQWLGGLPRASQPEAGSRTPPPGPLMRVLPKRTGIR